MKNFKIVGLLMVMVLVLAACSTQGKDDEKMMDEKVAEGSSDKAMADKTEDGDKMMNDDDHSADKMDKDDKMSDDKMDKDEKMSDDKMDKDDKMSDDKMDKDDKMSDDKMDKDDKMSDDKMDKDEKMSDDAHKMMNDGKEAVNFDLMDLNGNNYNLAELKGEKVYVKFWASWCSICLAGLEELDELAAADNDFKVLTIVTPSERGEKSEEDFKEWFASLGYDNITVLFDEDAEITSKYGVRGYPTSAYIGSDGILVKTLPGHKGNDAIRKSFDEIH